MKEIEASRTRKIRRNIEETQQPQVLCLGLVGNILRFLYISYLTNPWWVLPFEFMQGITHAAVWAACCSYIAHNTPQHLRSSAQGVLQGLHHGLGRGCGAVFGGIFVTYFGSTATFRGYGLFCGVILGAFVFINFYRKDTGFVSDIPVTEDPHQVAEETAHLAPHGVPSNPIPRALSSTRLHELATNEPGYGATYNTTGGNLDIPGHYQPQPQPQPVASNPSNPFLTGVPGGNYNYQQTNYQPSNYQQQYAPNGDPSMRHQGQSAGYGGGGTTVTSMYTQQPQSEQRSYNW